MYTSGRLGTWIKTVAFTIVTVVLCLILPYDSLAQPGGGVEAFAVDVPDPATVSGRDTPIRTLKITVSITSTASDVTFTVRGPHGNKTLDAGGGLYNIGSPQDRIFFDEPDPGAMSPADREYVISIKLDSDVDEEDGNCSTSTMSGDEQWTIQADDRKIESAHVESLPSMSASGGNCDDGSALDQSDSSVGPATIAEPDVDACGEGGSGPRPAVHAVLLLDGSGSMSNTVTGAASAEAKIDAVKDAVRDFVDVWEHERQSSTCAATPDDQIGVAIFRDEASWWSPLGTGLKNFPGAASTIKSNIGGLGATNTTALGQGLELADNAFSGSSSSARRVVLYLSNGIQNVRPYALNDGGSVVLEESSGATTTLDNLGASDANVFAVTVGTDAVTNPEVNQAIARGGGGDYINSETSATVLRPFFLEVLQENLAFATTQTALLESGFVREDSSYQTQVRFNTTTNWAAINVASPSQQDVLRVRATSPKGRTFEATGSGTVRLPVSFPVDTLDGTREPWDLAVEVADVVVEAADTTAAGQGIPFELNVMTDDPAVRADFGVDKDQYEVGDTVEVHARVLENGLPMDTLREEGTVQARVAEPGLSVGELLAQRDGGTSAPGQGDQLSENEAELYNLLQDDPDLLESSIRTVEMRDDGTNGDSVAEDGTFTGQFVADTAGHSNILFNVVGPSADAGLVQRQRRLSVYVRATPDPENTSVDTSTTSTDDGSLFRITITPRTSTGARIGPGWEHYFRFRTGDGQVITPSGNGDGSYTAEISYTGTVPSVDLHYFGGPRLIDNTTEYSPSLDDSTQLIADVGAEPDDGIPWKLVLLVLLGLLILAILIQYVRR